ncbi:SGNH/GDSL hydrolase family protein [Leucobacter soli]|uniref:SGNH hydrolase-type esterase domain-containing protein n=1 Tax=Leucobacter soli TaxID=2812850 RepID=A0A916NMC2_9MICO|nr:SGNH/GDSL hydrolase family protein [Leucobacter soli]CAG7601738.1 hypothetical protein LEUCIP111803_00499 [Leucobacter soli]
MSLRSLLTGLLLLALVLTSAPLDASPAPAVEHLAEVEAPRVTGAVESTAGSDAAIFGATGSANGRKIVASTSKRYVNPGAKVRITAKITGFPTRPSVRLQERRSGKWVTVKTLKRSSERVFRATVKRKASGAIRFRVIASASDASGKKTTTRSKTLTIRVRTVSTIQIAKTTEGAPVGRTFIEGRVRPIRHGVRVMLQRREGSSWAKVKTAEPDARGRFSFTVWAGPEREVYRVVRAAQKTATRPVSNRVSIRGTAPSVCTQPLAGTADARASLHERLDASADEPVVIVAAGSSTTFGSGATTVQSRWLNRFAAALSADYDLSGGPALPVLRQPERGWADPRETAGIHVVNAAKSASSSEDYLFSEPPSRMTDVIELEPDIVMHVVGAMDYRLNRDPAGEYIDGLRASIEYIDAHMAGNEPIHVLVHPHQRMRPEVTAWPWSAYRKAMTQVSAEDPERRIQVDVSGWFRNAGITGPDPWGLLAADRVHPSDAGHAALDGTVRRALDLDPAC